MQEKVSDFQVTFDDNVYLSIGLEAKHDIYNSFDPNEPYDIHLEPPSHDHPPLVKIQQKGKPLVYMSYHQGLRMTQWQLEHSMPPARRWGSFNPD